MAKEIEVPMGKLPPGFGVKLLKSVFDGGLPAVLVAGFAAKLNLTAEEAGAIVVGGSLLVRTLRNLLTRQKVLVQAN